jgi:uncharacterized membrane protein YcjF (UPF0283 family)
VAYKLVDSGKFNQNYQGHAERCIYTFTVYMPDQLGAKWTAEQMLNAHIEELQQQGSLILEYKLYEDAAPTFTTDYKVDIIASASPLWWNIIIIGVLALLTIAFTAWAIQGVSDIVEYSPGAAIGISAAVIAVAAVVGIAVLSRRGET